MIFNKLLFIIAIIFSGVVQNITTSNAQSSINSNNINEDNNIIDTVYKYISAIVPGIENFLNNNINSLKWTGFRFSYYGLETSFGKYDIPSPDKWEGYFKKIKSSLKEESRSAVILVAGEIPADRNGNLILEKCHFKFPQPENVPGGLNVIFNEKDHFEDYLKKFDELEIDVWLQVEPGHNNLVDLAKVLLDKYGHHSCVKGFGIDVEWYYRSNIDYKGRKLTDKEIMDVVDVVHSKNPNYTIFVKHWESEYMPPNYRDGLIFINDSERNENYEKKESIFVEWAKKYSNNPVMFQIGYPSDRDTMWKNDPVGFAKKIIQATSKYNNQIGIIWVDFSLKEFIDSIN